MVLPAAPPVGTEIPVTVPLPVEMAKPPTVFVVSVCTLLLLLEVLIPTMALVVAELVPLMVRPVTMLPIRVSLVVEKAVLLMPVRVPAVVEVPDVTMLLPVIVLPVMVVSAEPSVMHVRVQLAEVVFGVLLLLVIVLLLMLTGDVAVVLVELISVMVPVPGTTLLFTVLLFRLRAPPLVLIIPVKVAVVAAVAVVFCTVFPVTFTVAAEAVLVIPIIAAVVVLCAICTVLPVMFTVLLAAVLPMLFSMPVRVEVVAPLASVMLLLVTSTFDDVPVLQ